MRINDVFLDRIQEESQNSKERIFVIFRAEKNESEQVNRNRLNYVKWFLKEYSRWNVAENIFARGEKSEDEAKIEFYVGGKLRVTILSPKNKTPCLNCCDDKYYYPQNLVKRKSVKRN